MEITVGMRAEVFSDVEKSDTAAEVGSGSLLVYATPCMVALMEGAACEAIEEALDETMTTVGIELNIKHLSATPVGMDVRAEAIVTAIDGKVISFDLKAYDEATGAVTVTVGKEEITFAKSEVALVRLRVEF